MVVGKVAFVVGGRYVVVVVVAAVTGAFDCCWKKMLCFDVVGCEAFDGRFGKSAFLEVANLLLLYSST